MISNNDNIEGVNKVIAWPVRFDDSDGIAQWSFNLNVKTLEVEP